MSLEVDILLRFTALLFFLTLFIAWFFSLLLLLCHELVHKPSESVDAHRYRGEVLSTIRTAYCLHHLQTTFPNKLRLL